MGTDRTLFRRARVPVVLAVTLLATEACGARPGPADEHGTRRGGAPGRHPLPASSVARAPLLVVVEVMLWTRKISPGDGNHSD